MEKFKEIFTLFNFIVFTLVQGKIEHIVFNQDDHALAAATESLIIKFFHTNEYSNLRVNMGRSNTSSSRNVDVGNEVIKHLSGTFKFLTLGIKGKKMDADKRRSPVILTIDSIATFDSVKSRIECDIPKYYLILLTKGFFNKLDEILVVFWKNSISNVNFLMANQSNVQMYTFYPFAREKCGTDLSLELVNNFDMLTNSWAGNEFYPNKLNNLHSCMVKIGITINDPMVMFDERHAAKYEGIEIHLIKNLAEEFNFTPKFSKPFESIGTIRDNGSSSGLLGSLYTRQNDIAIGSLSLQFDRLKFLSASSSFATIPIVIVIPPTSSISPFEKLYLPFDLATWSLILIMFLIGYLVIILARFFSSTLYSLIVGKNVNYPFTNMFIAFFGNAQNVLPSANFSRFLLAKFLIFCLVIRGLYQGKLFDIMQKDIHEKESVTIDDLVQRNFIFYTYESLSRRVEGQSFAKKVKVIQNSELEEYRHNTIEEKYKGVVFSYEYQVVYLNKLHRKNFSYIILKERFVTNQMVFYFQENHYLSEIISEKIEWFREFGIINSIIADYVDPLFLNRIADDKPKEPLKFRDLSAVFGLWIAGLGIAFVSCLIEIGIECTKPRPRLDKKRKFEFLKKEKGDFKI